MSIPQRQLFLHRNIRKFKIHNALRKSPLLCETSNSSETIKSKDVSDDLSTTTLASSTKASTTLQTVSVQNDAESNARDVSPLRESDAEMNETVSINRYYCLNFEIKFSINQYSFIIAKNTGEYIQIS